MKREWDIEDVLLEIGSIVGELQKGKKCGLSGPLNFDLGLWNGINSETDETATASIWIWNVGAISSKAKTVSQGLLDVITQMYQKLGRYPKHECPTCGKTHDGYDLSKLPIDAFGELMQEIVEIAAAMSSEKTEAKIGRFQGPTVKLGINTMAGPKAKLSFLDVQKRFCEYGSNGYVFFVSKKGLCLIQAIDDVLDQAHEHLKKYGPHKCPVCGKMC